MLLKYDNIPINHQKSSFSIEKKDLDRQNGNNSRAESKAAGGATRPSDDQSKRRTI